jgi:hypothetical protein
MVVEEGETVRITTSYVCAKKAVRKIFHLSRWVGRQAREACEGGGGRQEIQGREIHKGDQASRQERVTGKGRQASIL